MAEVTSGNVTVMVLSHDESAALADVLMWVGDYTAGPWGDALHYLHGVYDALGVPAKWDTGGK